MIAQIHVIVGRQDREAQKRLAKQSFTWQVLPDALDLFFYHEPGFVGGYDFERAGWFLLRTQEKIQRVAAVERPQAGRFTWPIGGRNAPVNQFAIGLEFKARTSARRRKLECGGSKYHLGFRVLFV